ncbi:hypothetical protein BDW02DRAFT_10842 [Decorospora gaudefroyi]|uniref:Uncharacterized protein n=1 Tax=Decorospora gaudefroyi TaxID=184978 RepID=A0A6A5KR95_9PLEO|nr:hypothetical protein BDW02DRAFT_10842 [Decorospora gaudefroyi]
MSQQKSRQKAHSGGSQVLRSRLTSGRPYFLDKADLTAPSTRVGPRPCSGKWVQGWLPPPPQIAFARIQQGGVLRLVCCNRMESSASRGTTQQPLVTTLQAFFIISDNKLRETFTIYTCLHARESTGDVMRLYSVLRGGCCSKTQDVSSVWDMHGSGTQSDVQDSVDEVLRWLRIRYPVLQSCPQPSGGNGWTPKRFHPA